MNKLMYAVTLGLFLGWFCFGCGKSALEPATPVPSDCQEFLVKYFEAVKSKDAAAIKNLSSAFWDAAGDADSKGMTEADIEKMRAIKKKMIADNFNQMTEMFGDLKNYSVLTVKVTRISPEDRRPSNIWPVGIHAEIGCKAKFSKHSSVRVSLHLFKKTQESEYSILLWNYQTGL